MLRTPYRQFTAIGEQLRSEIEIPRDLPPQPALLVVQLQAA
jgi:hypothetical protein